MRLLLSTVLLAAAIVAPLRTPSAESPSLPLVYVLATGGTIASSGASSTEITDYSIKGSGITGEQLIAAVPELKQVARIVVEQVANVPSSDLTAAHWLRLAKRIEEIYRNDPSVAGVVITHGTDTMEETAYFLNLTVHDERPVVLVGSMRPATAISADGPINLYNAVRTAVSPEARGKGALIVLNDEINGARDATKTNTMRVETFRSADLGLLGYADGDRITFYRSTTRRHTSRSEFDVSALTELPRVDIVYSYADVSPDLMRAAIAAGAKGIVFAGNGDGIISRRLEEALQQAMAALPTDQRPVIVRSSRTGTGRVAPMEQFEKAGFLSGDNLNPQKARILLMLALTRTRDVNEVKRMFREY